jgi:site-specific recombinase XerD
VSAKKETTHIITEGELVVALRERSSIWQCRYRIGGVWQRTTTGERELKKAKEKAKKLYLEAQIRKENNFTPITRLFRDVARIVVKNLQKEIASGNNKASNRDYILAIENYLIPILGKYKVDNIDYEALEVLNQKRIERMEKEPAKSTLLTHNSALNKIFDEAIYRGYMNASNKPKLVAKGKESVRRSEFTIEEVKALRGNFDAWIERGRADTKELRALLKEYVEVLLNTGARPGKELLDLKWAQVQVQFTPVIGKTGKKIQPSEDNQTGEDEEHSKMVIKVLLSILTGKTSKKGGRLAVGNNITYWALSRIAQRNYGLTVKEVIDKHGQDYIFRYKEFINKDDAKLGKKSQFIAPTSFVKLFRSYLKEHNLLIHPASGKERQPYSLRHTYATIKLLYDKVQPTLLKKVMGTSTLMLDKHYEHIEILKAANQLSDEESWHLIQADAVVDEKYRFDETKAKKTRAKSK